MRQHEIVIRLRLPDSPQKRWLLAGIVTMVGVGAIAYAAVPNSFSPNTPISSKSVNDNFTYLDNRITTATNVEPTHTVTPINDWSNVDPAKYSSFGYFKDPLGIVHLRGFVKESPNSSHLAIYALPSTYRPASQLIFGASYFNTNTNAPSVCTIYVDAAGNITPDPTCSVTTTWVSLEGITFRADGN